MRPDPEIEEIRAARRRISERCGHDLKRLFLRYQQMERQRKESAPQVPPQPQSVKKS